MRCASSSSSKPSRSRLRLGALFCAIAVALASGASIGAPERTAAAYRLDGPVRPAASARLQTSAWQGGSYTAATGEPVRVLVSESYAEAGSIGRRWADYIASLPHGPELSLVTAYVLTQSDMRFFCGPYALGCYGGNELAFMGETVGGVTPEEVAAHEYGHHVAANRANPPWLALDQGPKRWASTANVCARAQRNEVYPGDEEEHYELNPGEGFAEVYRVLSELRFGASSFTWSLVDPSFSPDAAALQAAEQDVLAPWAAPVTQTVRSRFIRNGRATWKLSISTPLDGSLAVSLTFPRGALYELDVLAPGGRVLARGLWAGRAEKRASSTVCGERSLIVRVTRRGPAGRFSLRVTHD